MDPIESLTFTVSVDRYHEGYYKVATYVKQEAGKFSVTDLTDRLTWTEAIDVLLVYVDDNRPGTLQSETASVTALW